MTLDTKDPDPYTVYNGDSSYPYIVTVEHASNAIPKSLGNLGVGGKDLESHIAYDPYTKKFALDIAQELGCPVITSQYSRLVVDCNRLETSHQLIRKESDGIIIPGNQNLMPEDIQMRLNKIYRPYHNAIADVKASYDNKNKPCAFISMHSFTPMLNIEGKDRPWDVGFMWDHDDSLARQFHNFFKRNYSDIRVGLNVPYDARVEEKGAMHIHAWPYDIPAVEVELNFGTMADKDKYQMILSAFLEFMRQHENSL